MLLAPLVNAEMDGRFLYVTKSGKTTEYVLSDGTRKEAVKTEDINQVVKAIQNLGVTGSSNYVAIRTRGGVKMTDLMLIFAAIEKNPNWDLVVVEKGAGTKVMRGIVRHYLDENDPKKEDPPALEKEHGPDK